MHHLLPNEDVRPSQVVPVVVGDNQLDLMKWGFIPSWAKDEKVGYTMINARAETVDTKPTYKISFYFQRCLIPASGFYEWKNTPTGKVKYYFHLKDGGLFGFAGLYTVWKSKEGREVMSFTIITTSPNAVVEPIHDRMPVILKQEDEDIWLNPDETESDRLLALLTPYPAKAMERSKLYI